MQTTGKKITERYIVEKFVSHDNLMLPVISIKDHETPDFLVKTINRKISIELTAMINPTLREKEELQYDIVRRAKEIFLETYSANLNVYVTFSNKPLRCKNGEINGYAYKIAEAVKKIYNDNQFLKFSVSSRSNKPLNEFLSKLHVDNTFNFCNWQTFGAFKVDWVDFNWLTAVIENKEKNILKYEEACDEHWLVLTANFGTKSSAHRFDFINFKGIQTRFDKIFVFKVFENTITIIKWRN